MDPYQLMAKIQERMKDPKFAEKFNKLADELVKIPGLQMKVMQIAQIEDKKVRDKELDKLPSKAKKIVKDLLDMLN